MKITMLNQMSENSIVDYRTLQLEGIAHKTPHKRKQYKVVGGDQELTVANLTVRAHAFSVSARSEIERMGGKCEILPYSKTFSNLSFLEKNTLRQRLKQKRYIRLMDTKDEIVAKRIELLGKGRSFKSVRRCKKLGLSILNKYYKIIHGLTVEARIRALPLPRTIGSEEFAALMKDL